MKHKWHKEIKAWADGAEIEIKYLEGAGSKSGWMVMNDPDWDCYDVEYRIKPHAKCITKDCTNHVNEGKFIGDLCAPCWEYITNGKGIHSQAYRNAQPKEPQYLYVYQDIGKLTFESQNTIVENMECIGKIKLENDDV